MICVFGSLGYVNCVKEEKKGRSDRLSFFELTGLNPNFFSASGILPPFTFFFVPYFLVILFVTYN